ncbi:MAG TPA: BTAD domain-containing putative transcriptional regulator [Gaiellaceae bacterium]|nr:BTAD domain-containing putative transcriptional regulator [Gaiellaceae bacterium]
MDVRLTLLDGFELRHGDEPVALPLGSQRLVAFLALHDRPLLRVHVAGALWLDATEERSCANLRSALWRLRKPGCAIVEATSTHVGLSREVTVDVRELVGAARRLLDGVDGADPADLDEAWQAGELLPDWYDDWIETEREHVRQLRLHAVERFAEQLLDAGRYGQVFDLLLGALRRDPLRESAHRLVIEAHLAEGNWSEAIRHYRAYCERLRADLGLEPSPQIAELLPASTV